MSLPRRFAWLPALFAVACNPFKAEDPDVKAGAEAFDQSRFADADEAFDKALERDPSSEAHFGKGAAQAAQQKFDEAAEQLRRTLTTKDDLLRQRTYLNLGNTEAKAGRLDKAIDAYRRALQLDPADADARYNLEWALRAKQKQQEQQKNGQSGEKGEKGDQKGQQGQQQGQSPEKDQSGEPQTKQGNGSQDPSKNGDGSQDGQKDGEKGKQEQGGDQKGDPKKDDAQAANQPEPGEKGEQGTKPEPSEGGTPGEQDPSKQPGEAMAAGDAKDGPQAQQKPARAMGRQDAAQVLDALQASEKNLQMWRFQRKQGRNSVDQDW